MRKWENCIRFRKSELEVMVDRGDVQGKCYVFVRYSDSPWLCTRLTEKMSYFGNFKARSRNVTNRESFPTKSTPSMSLCHSGELCRYPQQCPVWVDVSHQPVLPHSSPDLCWRAVLGSMLWDCGCQHQQEERWTCHHTGISHDPVTGSVGAQLYVPNWRMWGDLGHSAEVAFKICHKTKTKGLKVLSEICLGRFPFSGCKCCIFP